jgi:hypothetical protein
MKDLTPAPLLPNPGGRPRKFTAGVVKRILRCASRGVPFGHAVKACGLSYQSFLNYRRDHPRFEEALARAVSKGIDRRLRILEELMESGDPAIRVRIITWFLEHAPGAAEHYSRSRVEVSGPDGQPLNVHLYLPQKATVEAEPRVETSLALAERTDGNGD